MAENNSEIVLQVNIDTSKVAKNLSVAIERVADLKKQQKELRAEIEKGNDATGEMAKQLASVQGELEANSRAVKSNTALLQAETLARIDENASLDEQRQALNAAQKAYAQLSGEAKKAADAEGGLADQIKALSDSVKAQEAALGDNRRNVGNYEESIVKAASRVHDLADAFKATSAGSSALGKGIDSLDKGMKLFSRNPVMGMFTMLAPLIAKIVGLVMQNKSAVEALHKILKPFGDVLQWIADLIANTLVAALDALAAAWNAVKSFFGTIVSWFTGGTSAVKENTAAEEEAARAAKEYADQVENLEKQLANEQKQLKQLRADNKYHIDMLKARGAAEKEIYEAEKKAREDELQQILDINTTAAEEMKAFKEKLRKEGKVVREDEYNFVVNLQGKEYEEFLAEYNRLRDLINNSYEDRKEKKREYDVWLAEEDTKERKRKEANAAAERSDLINNLEEERKIRQTFAEQQLNDLERQAERAKEKAEELIAVGKKALESFTEDEEDEEDIKTPDEMARDMFGLDAEGVEYFRKLLDDGVAFADAKTQALTEQTRRMAQNWATSFGQLGNAFSDMGDALGEFSEESETAAKAQKAFTMTGIVLNQAQSISEGALAIAKGVESAAAIPYPANIPAIISVVAQIGAMLAGVTTSIAQAKQLFSTADTQKFEAGGIVGGTSYTGDHVPVMANSGEMWINTESQKRLFDALTGNGDGSLGINYELMAAAVSAQPAPVLVLKELQDFEDKVTTFNEIASI